MNASIRFREVLAARPPDVRKGFAFPAASSKQERLCLIRAAQPPIQRESERKARGFPHIRRPSRNHLTERSEVLIRRKKLTDDER
jgi:hypothetical protein